LKKGQETAQKAQTELQHSRKKCEDVTTELTRQTSQVMTDAVAALKPMDHVTVHCVQKKTPTHIFFHISMSDV